MQDKFDAFQFEFPYIYTEKNFDFKRHTTIGIGGLAPLAVFPKNVQELQATIQYCLRHFVPYYPIGKGANLLVADSGFYGIVICCDKMQDIYLLKDRLYVECGISLSQLVLFAKKHALDGYVPLVGFPASVGGAIYMNAGVQCGHIGDLVQRVYTINREGSIQIFEKNACHFAYKSTVFMQNKAYIFAAELSANFTDIQKIEEQLVARKIARQYLPKERSMGCVFKNFEDVASGELIDLAGCKGLQIGGAKISTEHANFIVNIHQATAQDVRTLIAIAKRAVYHKFKRQLKEEIEYLGEFE